MGRKEPFKLEGRSAKKLARGPLGPKKPGSLKAKANETEAELADRLNGHRQPCSGAIVGHKGDVKLEHFLLDSKETGGSTILVSRKDLVKITREATGERLEPGLVLKFDKIALGTENQWAVIPLSVFAKMLEAGQDARLGDS